MRFNLASSLLEHNLEAGREHKVALRWRDEEHTYAELWRASGGLARAFTDLGLRCEERVLLVLSDRPEFCHAWFATLRCGAVFAMVNPALKEDDYAWYLEYTRARITVVDASLAPMFARLAQASPHLRAVVVAGGTASTDRPDIEPEQHAMADLIEAAPEQAVVAPTMRQDVAGWLFTSGSTGRPKAAVHFHEDFAFHIEHYAKGVLGLRETDVTAGVPKLFFGYATGTQLMFPFAVGASTAMFSERSTPEALFDLVTRFSPTVLTAVPTMLDRMLAHDRTHGPFDLKPLRMVLSAGEKLPDGLHRRWLDRFGVEILDGIGSAELFHIYISNRPGKVLFGSLGQAVPGYDCRILDDEGHELPPGEVGRLHVTGGSAALCYWHDRDRSRATFKGDTVVTGDLFRVDEEGCFTYAGRADELLKVGGVFVAPHEIEECLLSHEAVAEAAVVGRADAHGLVRPAAFVVPAAGHAAGNELGVVLQQWVKDKLAPFKYPRTVDFLEELPRNDRGKVERKALAGRAAP